MAEEEKQKVEEKEEKPETEEVIEETSEESKEKSPEKVSEELLKEQEEKAEEELEEEREKVIKSKAQTEKEEKISSWAPKTKLGKEVKAGKLKDIDEIIDKNRKILEDEIVDSLINVKTDLIAIGQSKGKFGGGKRRAWRQTQRKTKEGNVPTFSTLAVAGDENGHVGIGEGDAKETLPARDKALRKAKLNIIHIKRACAGFDCACSEKHSIPFEVEGKAGSVKIKLIPAPQGTGLVAGGEVKKILGLAGIKDVYSRTSGKKRTTFNLAKATIDALKKTNPEVYKK